MSRPAALLPHSPRFFLLFAAAELTLAMAVPFLAIKGYHTLLGSRAGVVTAEPTEGTPGWSARVEPTTVIGVAEVFDQRLTGFAIVVVGDEGAASSVILGSAGAEVDGVDLSTVEPAEAMDLVAAALRLRLSSVELVDGDAWRSAFGSTSLDVDNPDPVVDASGTELFDVGTVKVSGEQAAGFLGLPPPGSTLVSLAPRRQELWSVIMTDGLTGSGPLAALFPPGRASASSSGAVFNLPVTDAEAGSSGEAAADDEAGGHRVDLERSEELLRTLVAFPAGRTGTDRLRVRIVDGHGDADLQLLASQIAARGLEVVEISTATTVSDEPSRLVVPIELAAAVEQAAGSSTATYDALSDLELLESEFEVEQRITTRSDDLKTVTLVVGPELEQPDLVSALSSG